jgi:DNA-directed RNA polymerase subunit RPC12/RpoP
MIGVSDRAEKCAKCGYKMTVYFRNLEKGLVMAECLACNHRIELGVISYEQ